jgi:hypothetical protein
MKTLNPTLLVSRFNFAGLRTLTVLLGLATSVAAFAADPELPHVQPGDGWEEISNSDGILCHRKSVPGSSLVAFRGEAMIDAPIAKVAQVLSDTPRKLDWIARIVEAKNIRTISDMERIEYNHTGAPWPVKDRDFVFHAKVDVDKANRRLLVRIKSQEDPAMPEQDCCVRGSLNNSLYTLTSVEGGKRTHVAVEIHADPKGSLPSWVVNLIQKGWPSKTLAGIRRQVAKPDVGEMESVKKLFAELHASEK